MCSNTREIPILYHMLIMAHKKLSRIKSLSTDLAAKLRLKNIYTCKDLICQNPLELMDILDITYPQVLAILSTVSEACAPSKKNVLDLFQETACDDKKMLSTSISHLDLQLKGGLPASTLTEISGPPGCGKTQFCIMLSVLSALPVTAGGRGSPVVYIDTEGAFSAERLIEMASCRLQSFLGPQMSNPDSRNDTIENWLDQLARNVLIFKRMTCRDLLECLEKLELVITSSSAGLVVVDSIASLVRKEFDASSKRGVIERTSLLLQQATRLKYLAESFGIQVVVTNQIVTQLPKDGQEPNGVDGDKSIVTSALGNSWYHTVNTRLFLDYNPCLRQGRELTVIKSPLCGRCSFSVIIEGIGFTTANLLATESDELKRKKQAGTGSTTLHRQEDCFHTAFHRGFPLEFPGQ